MLTNSRVTTMEEDRHVEATRTANKQMNECSQEGTVFKGKVCVCMCVFCVEGEWGMGGSLMSGLTSGDRAAGQQHSEGASALSQPNLARAVYCYITWAI